MNVHPRPDLCLLSWNILAPCWVNQDWYPTLFEIAVNHHERLNKIGDRILSLGYDVVLIQEAQEDTVLLLRQKLDDHYVFHSAWNHPTAASVRNGLLTLIRKNWKYASTTAMSHGILDVDRGEAIQIMTIPSKNIHIVNLHLDYTHRLCQAKLVKDKCRILLDTTNSVTILAGDMNAETDECDRFEWNDFEDVFRESDHCIRIPTFYSDPSRAECNTAIDHIFYNPYKLKLIEHGKAWDISNGSLADALTEIGSDHIYVWARFNFCP
ncbi:unnamed protein product [Rotaria sp. Silwood2]|nr:unnamed protein product [Rotaria sp. Silwood2]CAF2736338.1 unnamed protein product [Rotaria sp. Silwood2]CAF3130056.1 unnamed protein product [Rotaria sp. Silwood2]CAF3963127.1 unnamed protein product [Rotaria sp. Silwood2]CAF4017886.1 unnamed protein product [Rotaria sp. Silwood2]